MSKQQDVFFSVAQLKYLESLFPHTVLGHTASESAMRHYFGQQEVLQAVRRKTRGLNGLSDNDVPSPAG